MQKPLLKLAPERRQILSYAIRGALEILQMPQLELGNWLLEQIEKNPLLEICSPKKTFRFEGDIPAQPSLHEHLLTQIRETLLDKDDRKIAYALLEHLDEKGFLLSSYETLKEDKLDHILTILQSFDPPGIFARNIQESLLLQLKAKGKENHLSYRLVKTCFDDLLHGRYSRIKQKLALRDLSPAIQDLARLSLQPANCFKNEPSPAIHIDLRISKIENSWTLELIEEDLPKVQISNTYLNLREISSEEREVLREFETQANWILHSLKRRRKLLLQLGKILICKQWRFLEGRGDLIPLSVRELSEKLGVHESTLSRALSGKYAQTPKGILPLKALISIAPQTLSAKQMLEKLIRSEDQLNPLTDDRLAELLREKGFKLARRTIAKYRSQLKIGSVNQRKHINKRASTPYLGDGRE